MLCGIFLISRDGDSPFDVKLQTHTAKRESDSPRSVEGMRQVTLPCILSIRMRIRCMVDARNLTPDTLASAIGVSLSTLNWLAYQKEHATVDHYFRYKIPKSSGGYRHISAPKPYLKKVQRWIDRNILASWEVSPYATAYVPNGGIAVNATPHIGRKLIIHLDLIDFFHSISYPRIKGLFLHHGFSQEMSTLLALLCTEYPRKELFWPCSGGRVYIVDQACNKLSVTERVLLQGACTSPTLSNAIAKPMDTGIGHYVEMFDGKYTRYSDDIYISFPQGALPHKNLFFNIKQTIANHGFTINDKKTRFTRSCAKQVVTGVVVNNKLNISRDYFRLLRTRLHYCDISCLQPYLGAKLAGMVSFVRSLSNSKARILISKYQWLNSSLELKEKSKEVIKEFIENEKIRGHRNIDILYTRDSGVVVGLFTSCATYIWSCRDKRFISSFLGHCLSEYKVVEDVIIRQAAVCCYIDNHG